MRGMNTDLNAMTIGGVSVMSPEDRRGIILDGVPSDMLDNITVYKTLQPFFKIWPTLADLLTLRRSARLILMAFMRKQNWILPITN